MAWEDIGDDSVCEGCQATTLPCKLCAVDLACPECDNGLCPACTRTMERDD